jgi:hypothetical protein
MTSAVTGVIPKTNRTVAPTPSVLRVLFFLAGMPSPIYHHGLAPAGS